MTAADTHRAIDAVWRIESPRLIAGLARVVRDVGLAEELAQDALVIALEQWPESGVPDNPGAWLMTTAKRRAIDHFRRNKRVGKKHLQLGYELEARGAGAAPDLDAALDDDIGDDLLRLMFTACHPVLSAEARLPSVRGDLRARLGRHEESRAEFERAAALTRNERERALLLARAARSGQGAEP